MKALIFYLYFIGMCQSVKPKNEVHLASFIRAMLEYHESNSLMIFYDNNSYPQPKMIRVQNFIRQNLSLTISCLSYDQVQTNWPPKRHQSSSLTIFFLEFHATAGSEIHCTVK